MGPRTLKPSTVSAPRCRRLREPDGTRPLCSRSGSKASCTAGSSTICSKGAAVRRSQLGRSVLVPGRLTDSSWPSTSSSCTRTSPAPLRASASLTAASTELGVVASPPSSRSPAGSPCRLRAERRSHRCARSTRACSAEVASSWPYASRSSMSRPAHQPLNVGRSWVEKLATQPSGGVSSTGSPASRMEN